MGLSIAFHLADHGARPLVLERRFVGSGSTGKSGAIIRQHYSLELTAAMARDSLNEYATFEDRVGGSAGFVRSGMALIVAGKDRDGLSENVDLQRSLGIRTEMLDARQLREAVPGAEVSDDSVGCFEPDAGFADPARTLQSLSAALRRMGGDIREGVAVRDFVLGDSKVRGVVTNEGEVEVESIVVAAGAWAGPLMERVDWEAEIAPMRVQTAVFRPPAELPKGPVIIDFVNEMYAKQADDTHVGSILPTETEPADPDDYDECANMAYLNLAHERLSRRIPAMQRASRFGGYGALYAVTPDWHPVVGSVGPEGLYLCAGFSGHGFKLAPSIGRTVAAELLGKPAPYDFSLFRPQRFRAGRKVAGRYSYSILG